VVPGTYNFTPSGVTRCSILGVIINYVGQGGMNPVQLRLNAFIWSKTVGSVGYYVPSATLDGCPLTVCGTQGATWDYACGCGPVQPFLQCRAVIALGKCVANAVDCYPNSTAGVCQ